MGLKKFNFSSSKIKTITDSLIEEGIEQGIE